MSNLYVVCNFYIDIPKVEVGSTTQIVEYGRNVILNCNVTSLPVHTSVYWQRTSSGLTTNITTGNLSSEKGTTLNHSLIISIAKPADTGLYTCYAINIVGTGRSKAINLTIIGGKVPSCFKHVEHFIVMFDSDCTI